MAARPLVYQYLIILCSNLSVSGYLGTWCDPILCVPEHRHIACENDGSFHERCMPDSVDIDISGFKRLFVDGHNKRRNLIALGYLPGYYPAAQMATMKWDAELQYLATLNLHTCILDHDDCHNTYRFETSGQNLCAVSRDRSRNVNVTNLVEQALNLWFNEYPLIDSSYISKFRVTEHFEDYGHFAEMVVDRNSHIGCAIIRFTRPEYPLLYIYNIVCNYDSIYALDAPVYIAGYPASKCMTQRNPIYPGLCSTMEEFNPNY